MKYIVIIIDGLSENQHDSPTTMQLSKTPNLDNIYRRSEIGNVNCIKEGFSVASDIANMAILGYDPEQYYSGRAFLEAKAHDIEIKSNEVIYRANLVKMSSEINYRDKTMIDFTSSNITTKKAQILLEDINKQIDDSSRLVCGSSYHHMLITSNKENFNLYPPHEIMQREIKPYLSEINDDDYFFNIMKNSETIIDKRFNSSSLWLWSRSTVIEWPTFKQKHNIEGAMISAVDALRGIAKLSDLELIEVDGATGDHHTNYQNKINKALTSNKEFVFVHIEACDYCSHQGNKKEKIKALEAIDQQVISKLTNYNKPLRVLILPDHNTSPKTKMHESGNVPLMLFDNRNLEAIREGKYDEQNFNESKIFDVLELMSKLLLD